MKILLLGKGQLGKEIYRYLKVKKFNISFYYKKISNKKFDLTKKKNLQKIFLKEKPSIVINCIAFTDVDLCEKFKNKALKVNYKFVKRLVNFSNQFNSRLIHFSTDYIFDGKKKTYSESDKGKPINFYGYTKYLSDKYIIKSCKKYLILRVSWLYSENSKNFINKIIYKLKSLNNIKVTPYEYGVPNDVEFISYIVYKLINLCKRKKYFSSSILNVSSSGRASRYQVSMFVKKNLKKNIRCKIIKTSIPTIALRPFSTVLSSKKLEKLLNIKIKNWKFYLLKFIKKYEL